MDLRSLRFFLAVAEEKSIKKGAESLHLTQPNITRTIRELEEELGVTLFIRSTRAMTLTPEGELLRQRAEEMMELVQKTRTEIRPRKDAAVTGDVHIAAGESENMRVIVQAMCRTRAKHPGVRFQLFSGNGEAVSRRIDAGTSDIGAVFEPFDVTPYHHQRLPLQETWGAVMREDNPLAAETTVTPALLAQEPLILSTQWINRNGLASWFGPLAKKLTVVATHMLINTPRLMVEEGLGTVITFRDLVKTGPGTGLVFRPLDPPLHASLYLIRKKNSTVTPPLAAFLEELTALLPPQE